MFCIHARREETGLFLNSFMGCCLLLASQLCLASTGQAECFVTALNIATDRLPAGNDSLHNTEAPDAPQHESRLKLLQLNSHPDLVCAKVLVTNRMTKYLCGLYLGPDSVITFCPQHTC